MDGTLMEILAAVFAGLLILFIPVALYALVAALPPTSVEEEQEAIRKGIEEREAKKRRKAERRRRNA